MKKPVPGIAQAQQIERLCLFAGRQSLRSVQAIRANLSTFLELADGDSVVRHVTQDQLEKLTAILARAEDDMVQALAEVASRTSADIAAAYGFPQK